MDTLITPNISSNFGPAFSPQRLIYAGLDFMIRSSTSRSTICLTNPHALAELVSPVQKAYRELLDLRERVKRAEATTQRLGARDRLKTCARPVARIVSRKPITRRPREFTKHQLHAMLAEAVRNTH